MPPIIHSSISHQSGLCALTSFILDVVQSFNDEVGLPATVVSQEGEDGGGYLDVVVLTVDVGPVIAVDHGLGLEISLYHGLPTYKVVIDTMSVSSE